jgi:muramoyltetrapeptide carboxypeptidase
MRRAALFASHRQTTIGWDMPALLHPWQRSRRLALADAVAVIAPSGPVPEERYLRGLQRLATRYTPRDSSGVLSRQGFLAGDDGRRLAELRWALLDPRVHAVICARGGYGLLRLTSRLAAMATDPRACTTVPVIGFSDITVLHALCALRRQVSIHGPVVTQLGELSDSDVQALWALLEDPSPPPPLVDLTPLSPDRRSTHGRLLGGNLEMLSRLCGTPLGVALTPGEPVILLIEEVGEAPYRIDRSLTQLAASGLLRDVAAIVVGDLTRCQRPSDSADQPDALTVIAERARSLGLPVWAGAPLGHGERNRAVPLGVAVTLDGAACALHFHSGAVI